VPGTSWFAVGAGAAQIFDPRQVAMVTFEYRYSPGRLRASPWLAAEATDNDRFFGFGAYVDIAIGRRVNVTPALGAAMYHGHDGLGLGWHFEYRSSLEVTWPVGGARIGAAFAHFSNDGLGHHNPGTEILRVMWIVPIGKP
jgi:lipid A 3-O-deacylase PagL